MGKGGMIERCEIFFISLCPTLSLSLFLPSTITLVTPLKTGKRWSEGLSRREAIGCLSTDGRTGRGFATRRLIVMAAALIGRFSRDAPSPPTHRYDPTAHDGCGGGDRRSPRPHASGPSNAISLDRPYPLISESAPRGRWQRRQRKRFWVQMSKSTAVFGWPRSCSPTPEVITYDVRTPSDKRCF